MRASWDSILCLGILSWDFLWQRHQTLMMRFVQDGIPVLYVEPLGVRTPGRADWRRILTRLRNWWRGRPWGLEQRCPGLYVWHPLILPFHNANWLRPLNRQVTVRWLREVLRHLGMQAPLLWTYPASYLVLTIIKEIKPSLVVYDSVDAVHLNPRGMIKDYAASEMALLKHADIVLASSSRLYEAHRVSNPHTYLVKHGVDIERFLPPGPAPDEVKCLPRPRIAFFGGIDHRLDMILLRELAAAWPQGALVLIGTVQTNVAILQQQPNIYFLGERSHHELPLLLGAMDMLVIPYVLNDYTQHIFPAKVYECLATGLPTVATALPEIESLSDVIDIGYNHSEFINKVRQALVEDTPERRKRRQAVALGNSWDARYADIRSLLATR